MEPSSLHSNKGNKGSWPLVARGSEGRARVGKKLRMGTAMWPVLLLWLLSCTGPASPAGEPPVPGSPEPTPVGGTTVGLEKLDQRLIEEIRIRREIGLAAGKSLEEIAQEPFEVTIELLQPLSIPTGMPRQQALEEMERQAEQAQAGVVESLHALGVTEFERQILSNSIAATLTLDQITEIAKRDDVKIIRLVKVEKVIT